MSVLKNIKEESNNPNLIKTDSALALDQYGEAAIGTLLALLAPMHDQLFYLDTQSKRSRYNFDAACEIAFFGAYLALKAEGYPVKIQGSYLEVDTQGQVIAELEQAGLTLCENPDSTFNGKYYFSQFGRKPYCTGKSQKEIVVAIHRA